MVFEGLVIHRVAYKERDLIVKLILRNGTMGSFYIYGGQGGGKHHKPSSFEIGSMMKIMIKEQRSHRIESSELMIAAESSKVWEPLYIRHNIQAFYLVCLYFEILQKFAVSFQLGSSDYEHTEHEGVFSVVSNALFYLDEALKNKNFIPEQHLALFLVKLLFHLGIMPDTDHCGYCGTELIEAEGVSFLTAQGQFSCLQCVTGENEKGLLLRMKKGYQTHFQDYLELTGVKFQECDKLIHYFCHHFHLKPLELRSYGLLFK